MKRPNRVGWVLTIALLALSGCAPATFRINPQYETKLNGIKTVALMPADVKVYRLTAGGVKELIDEWSVEAKRNTTLAVVNRLSQKGGFAFKEFSPGLNPVLEDEYQDVRALFEAVAGSIHAHTYRPETIFQTKVKAFDYTLGPVESLARAAEADAMLFLVGVDHISTGGRIALQAMSVLLAAAVGVSVIPQGGTTVLLAALVDAKSGDVLWFDARVSGGAHDLRKPESAAALVDHLFTYFHGSKR